MQVATPVKVEVVVPPVPQVKRYSNRPASAHSSTKFPFPVVPDARRSSFRSNRVVCERIVARFWSFCSNADTCARSWETTARNSAFSADAFRTATSKELATVPKQVPKDPTKRLIPISMTRACQGLRLKVCIFEQYLSLQNRVGKRILMRCKRRKGACCAPSRGASVDPSVTNRRHQCNKQATAAGGNNTYRWKNCHYVLEITGGIGSHRSIRVCSAHHRI